MYIRNRKNNLRIYNNIIIFLEYIFISNIILPILSVLFIAIYRSYFPLLHVQIMYYVTM